jgi:hypothetical protein
MQCDEPPVLRGGDHGRDGEDVDLADLRSCLTLLAELNAQHYGVNLCRFRV